ncbi:MAG: hypothetical protein ACYCSZ_12440 [Burkholderiales bacterium]
MRNASSVIASTGALKYASLTKMALAGGCVKTPHLCKRKAAIMR